MKSNTPQLISSIGSFSVMDRSLPRTASVRGRKLRIGLYGSNGHPLTRIFAGNAYAEIGAVALLGVPEHHPDVQVVASLDELLADDSLDLISLCSPRRRDQADDAIRCLEAGKHVYAEKPCALSEFDLDRILAASWLYNRAFRETAGTAFVQPYRAMGALVKSGRIGRVIQVFAQKSYPFYNDRPASEDLDGGLTLQVGIHAVRMIEHVTGIPLKTLQATELRVPGIGRGDLRVAATLTGSLENGALVSAVLNYMNPKGTGVWGNDHLRIFGENGMLESINGATSARLVLDDGTNAEIEQPTPSLDYFTTYAASLLGAGELPLSIDTEMHSLRVLLRAKQALDFKTNVQSTVD